MKMAIRKMGIGDLEEVHAIENMSFKQPWHLKSFYNELQKEYGFQLVVVIDNAVIAYLIAWLVVDEIHIANIAVHPKWRRMGIAEKLLTEIIQKYKMFHRIWLEVRESNQAARSLYQKLGFCVAGVRKNYYSDQGEDAVLMFKNLQVDQNKRGNYGMV